MGKVSVGYTDYFGVVMDRMREDGLLLVTKGSDAAANVMTIGWGTVGIVWGLDVFVVLVRPSRYSYSRLEEVGEFTVNVPGKELGAAALHCGTVSGRDNDKFEQMELTVVPGEMVEVPVIEECLMHYECRVVHRNDVVAGALAEAIVRDAYPQADFHRVYYGEILGVWADTERLDKLVG